MPVFCNNLVMMSKSLQAGFVLHTRPYKETSLLLDLFTRESGRVAAVAKGAKRAKSTMKGLLQPFTPLLVALQGQHDLMNLNSAELLGSPLNLVSKKLMAGFYINELILKLLHRHDAHPDLFDQYQQTIIALSYDSDLEICLRTFEFSLLDNIGYGLNFICDSETLEPINADLDYSLVPKQGFVKAMGAGACFSGKVITAISERDFIEAETRRDAKRITRFLINNLLGQDTLKTREAAGYFSF